MSSLAGLGALAPIVARKHAEVAALRGRSAALWEEAARAAPVRALGAQLRGGAVIAEIKRRSPSGGELRADLDAAALARVYEAAGAAALSVLTDAEDFGGGLDDLAAARGAVVIPVLRKDFVVDPLQIAQARAAGADAVLLIVAVLGPAGLDECLAAAAAAGLDALVEVHDEREARTAAMSAATLLGVNNRDLRSLRTDLATFARIRPLFPPTVTLVAESGVRTPGDAARLVGEGADAVLVGEALLRAVDPGACCAAVVAAARAAARTAAG